MLNNLKINSNAKKLKDSLNPLSKNTLGLKEADLLTIQNWNIE
jgi:hypothetical protein